MQKDKTERQSVIDHVGVLQAMAIPQRHVSATCSTSLWNKLTNDWRMRLRRSPTAILPSTSPKNEKKIEEGKRADERREKRGIEGERRKRRRDSKKKDRKRQEERREKRTRKREGKGKKKQEEGSGEKFCERSVRETCCGRVGQPG